MKDINVKSFCEGRNYLNKTLTVRLPADLDDMLTKWAKENDLSKNQVIKAAIRKLLKEQREKDAG